MFVTCINPFKIGLALKKNYDYTGSCRKISQLLQGR